MYIKAVRHRLGEDDEVQQGEKDDLSIKQDRTVWSEKSQHEPANSSTADISELLINHFIVLLFWMSLLVLVDW